MVNYTFKIFNLLNSKQRLNSIYVLILLLFAAILEALGIGLIFPLITVILGNDQENDIFNYIFFVKNNLFSEQVDILIFVLISTIVFFLIKNLILFFINWQILNFTTGLIKFYSSALFKIYLNKEYLFHKNKNSSLLTRNIKTECERFGSVFFVFLQLISEILIIFTFFILFIFLFGLKIIVILLMFFVIGLIFDFFTKGKLNKWGNNRQKYDAAVFKNIEEGFNSIKEIKLMNKESIFINFFKQDMNILINSNKKFNILLNSPKLIIEFVAILLIISVFYYYLILDSNYNQVIFFASSGVLVASLYRLIPSVIRIISYVNRIKFDLPVVDLIRQEFINNDNLEDNQFINNQFKEINFTKSITFENVNFRYNENRYILSDLNFDIEIGKITGIFGKTGSGKSTLVDLILGFILPNSGKIYIDEYNLNSIKHAWRNKIGYVSQNIYLIDSSIQNNIAFNYDEKVIDKMKIDECIKIACLDDLKDMIDNNIYIGQDGSKLSGGQKQRIGIARSVYNNPNILILDEATNQLDEKTRYKIFKNIFNLNKNITIIMVSHDSNHKMLCDKVLIVKDGLVITDENK